MGKLEGEDKDISDEIELLNEGFDGEVKSKKSKKSNGTRPNEKSFHPRNSLLTDLLATKHGQAVYNVCVAFSLLQITHLAARSYFEGSGFDFGQRTLIKAFKNFHVALGIWLAIQFFVLSLYFCFKSWLARRSSVKNQKFYNVCGTAAFVIFYLLALPAYSAFAVLSRPLGMAASALIALEVVRFLMKMYAFVRSNANKSLETMPSFNSYLYFLFAPTLIFSEDYPRLPEIHWRFVAQCVAEVANGALLIAAIIDLYIQPMFEDFGTELITSVDFIDRMFSCTMPGLVVAVTVFYCFFHSWMNGFAEVLRFADRAFYSDWWTSTSFREFNRKWNAVVQDWIFFYLYRDLRSIFKSKFNCLLVIGVVTALAVEYILSMGTRMVVPICGWVLLVQPLLINWTGSGRCINFIICLGMSLCVMLALSLYSMEIFARQNQK